MIIGLSGKKGSGKSTVAKYLCDEHDFIELSFAYPLKQIASSILNIPLKYLMEMSSKDKEKIISGSNVSYREFYQKFGTDFIRNTIDKDFWVKKMENEIMNQSVQALHKIANIDDDYECNLVISDIRFKNEFECVDKLGICINILKNNTNNPTDHESEQIIEDVIFDYEIANVGTVKDLENKISNIVERYR